MHRTSIFDAHYFTLYMQAEVGRYPYMALLNMGANNDGSINSPYCGGTMVAPDIVLTAGEIYTTSIFMQMILIFNTHITHDIHALFRPL